MEPTSHERALLAGRYRLRELIGRGGMASVWAGHDEVLGRAVAVKEVALPPELDLAQRRTMYERTLREARVAARLSSPSTVTVYDVVEADDRPWIVMERVEAPTLSEILTQRGPLPFEEVAGIGRSVLDALDEAHAEGVLHRDVKPANIMVRADGRVVLTDFGVAIFEGDPSLTATGMIVGSPAYMAPERAHGDAATAASDLWSLGATMYAAVEGHPPFDRGGQLPTLHAVVHEELPPPTRAGPLAPVLSALLAKTPADRPDRRRLRQMLDQLPTTTTTTPLSTPETPSTREKGARPSGEQTQVLPIYPAAEAGGSGTSEPGVRPATQPPSTDAARRSGRRPAALALAAAMVVAALAGGSYAVFGGQEQDRTAAGGRKAPGNNAAAPAPTGGERDRAPGDSAEGAGSGSAAGADSAEGGNPGQSLPPGFRMHRDPTGFSVGVPKDWRVKREGSTVNIVDPDGGGFLRIDQTSNPKPDPVADWRAQEKAVSRDLPGYERIRIEPVDYRRWEAADWEFTWQSDSGQIHVLNRNVITGPNQAYALYWSMPERTWDESLSQFRVVAQSFRPAGAS